METYSRREFFKKAAKTVGVVVVTYTPAVNATERWLWSTSYKNWGPVQHAMSWVLENLLGR